MKIKLFELKQMIKEEYCRYIKEIHIGKLPDKWKGLADLIVKKKGKITAKDFEKLGIPFEAFLKLANTNKEKLVKNAESMLRVHA